MSQLSQRISTEMILTKTTYDIPAPACGKSSAAAGQILLGHLGHLGHPPFFGDVSGTVMGRGTKHPTANLLLPQADPEISPRAIAVCCSLPLHRRDGGI